MHEPSGSPFSVHGGRVYRDPVEGSGRSLRGSGNRRVGPSALWGALQRLWAALGRALPPVLRFLGGVVAIALCTCGMLAFWDGVVHSDHLAVRELVVLDGTPRGRGAQAARRFVQPAEVVALADVPIGSPILLVDRDAVAQKIMRHPYVLQATVHRQLPGRLTVHLVEQQPSLLVSLKELYVASERGELFKTFSAADKLNLPMVTGLHDQGAGASMQQVQRQVQRATALAAAISTHPMEISSLDELHWDRHVGWSAVVETLEGSGGRVRMHLGMAPQERLPLALSTLRFLMEKSQTPAVIWADGSKQSGRVQVRLVDAPTHLSHRGAHGTES